MRLAVIGQILRRRWRLLLALAVLGAIAGAAASLLWPPGYESSSRVLLQGSPDKSKVLSEVQLAMSLVVLDRAAAQLHWGVSGTDLQGSVQASVIDGNVIGITATADSPERARQLAEGVTQQYITFSTEILTKSTIASNDSLASRKDSLQKQIADMNRRISEMQGSALLNAADVRGATARAEVQQLSSSRTQAVNELNEIDGRIAEIQAQAAVSRENFSVIEPPVTPRAPVARSRPLLVTGGAVLAAVLGAFVLVVIQHADRRLRRGSDIAAALGAPLLGTVEVPARGDPGTAGEAGPDQPLEYVRYRRVLIRLGGAPDEPLRLLVVITDGDELASRAVAQLEIAGTSADQAPARPAAVLSVVSVSAVRPTIPEPPGVSGVLVVVTSGTRTAWQLLSVAEACQDAGHPVAGVLVVLPGSGPDVGGGATPDRVRRGAAVGRPRGHAGEDPA
jgi:capsular polysaccharide biosynthesis protein